MKRLRLDPEDAILRSAGSERSRPFMPVIMSDVAVGRRCRYWATDAPRMN